MRLLEAFIEVKLTGLSRVNRQLDQLVRRIRQIGGIVIGANLASGVIPPPVQAPPLPTIPGINQAGNARGFFQTLQNISTVTAVLSRIFRTFFSVLRAGFNAAILGAKLFLTPLVLISRTLLRIVRLAPLLAGIFSAAAIRNLLTFQQEIERIRLLFAQAFGTSASTQLDNVRQLARELGVEFILLAESFGRFAAATRGTIALEGQENLFRGVTQAAVALGLESDKVQSIFVALEQIASKGRISMEELRRQLGNALPGAFAIAARAVNKTTQELETLIEKGRISPSEFLTAFGPQLIEEFGARAAAASNTLGARIRRLINGFTELRESISGIVTLPIIRFLETLASQFQRLGGIQFINELAAQFGAFVETLTNNLGNIFKQFRSIASDFGTSINRLAVSWTTQLAAGIPIIIATVAIFLNLWSKATSAVSGAIARVFGAEQPRTLVEALALVLAVIKNIDQFTIAVVRSFKALVKDADLFLRGLITSAKAILEIANVLSFNLIGSVKDRFNAAIEEFKQNISEIELQKDAEDIANQLRKTFDDVKKKSEEAKNQFNNIKLPDFKQAVAPAIEQIERIRFFDVEALQRSLQEFDTGVSVKTLDVNLRQEQELKKANALLQEIRDSGRRDSSDRKSAQTSSNRKIIGAESSLPDINPDLVV